MVADGTAVGAGVQRGKVLFAGDLVVLFLDLVDDDPRVRVVDPPRLHRLREESLVPQLEGAAVDLGEVSDGERVRFPEACELRKDLASG